MTQTHQDEQITTLTAGDILAQRLSSLVIAFSNTTMPLSSTYIHHEYYPNLREESFSRQFRRDRERLVLCGCVIREDPERGWYADTTSFADEMSIDPDDALALDLICLQLTSDRSFPYRHDLRGALTKLDRSFSDSSQVAPSVEVPDQDRRMRALLHAETLHHAVHTTYSDAQGRTTSRTLALFGEFGFRDHIYFVAADMDERTNTLSAPHVFRDDRFSHVQELETLHYEVPADFCAESWRKLPFQMGSCTWTASFVIPPHLDKMTRTMLKAHGDLRSEANQDIWQVNVADLDAAAAWAIAEGLIPLAPVKLVDIWRTLLQEAAQ